MPGRLPGHPCLALRFGAQERDVDGRNKSGHDGCGGGLVNTIVIALAVAASVSQAGAQALPGGFVYLRDIDPTIIQDIRYAGANNFVGRRFPATTPAECVVKRSVGLALKSHPAGTGEAKTVAENVRLLPAGAGVARHGGVGAERQGDAGRAALQSGASPRPTCSGSAISPTHSGHSTGVALDLTLVDLTADNSASVRSRQNLCRLHRAGKRPRAGRQRRHGHRL